MHRSFGLDASHWMWGAGLVARAAVGQLTPM